MHFNIVNLYTYQCFRVHRLVKDKGLSHISGFVDHVYKLYSLSNQENLSSPKPEEWPMSCKNIHIDIQLMCTHELDINMNLQLLGPSFYFWG